MLLGSALIEDFVKNKFIIDTPGLQSLRLKYTSTLLTLVFWIVWFYLWVPLITLAGWWFQIQLFQKEMVVVDGLDAFLQALPIFVSVALVLTCILGLWALYNYKRFKGIDRRKPLPPVGRDDLLQLLPITESELDTMQANKISTVEITENGAIIASTKP